MPSEHINLKLSQEYMQQLKEIGYNIGIKDISKVYGAIPTIVKFSITYTNQTIKNTARVIPTLEPRILEVFLTSIKDLKIKEYYEKIKEKKEKELKK